MLPLGAVRCWMGLLTFWIGKVGIVCRNEKMRIQRGPSNAKQVGP